jgi:hypothetical protein
MAKRLKVGEECKIEAIKVAVLTAMEEPFPWIACFDSFTKETIEIIAKSKNTSPEFVLMGLLVATSAVLGPLSTVQLFPSYEEPLNLFVICVGPPGAGKTQALNTAVRSPVSSIIASWNSNVILDDFTREGFRRHLLANNGRVLVLSDEIASLFDTLEKKGTDSSADRNLFCRLFDSTSWTRTTGLPLHIYKPDKLIVPKLSIGSIMLSLGKY